MFSNVINNSIFKFLFYLSSLTLISCVEYDEKDVNLLSREIILDQAINEHRVIFHRLVTFGNETSQQEIKELYFDSFLESTIINPIHIPVEAYTLKNKHVSTFLNISCEGGLCSRQELISDEGNFDVEIRDSDFNNISHIDGLKKSLNQEIMSDRLSENDVVYVTIGLLPQFEYNQYKYINWFGDDSNLVGQSDNLTKKDLLRIAEQVRREDIKYVVDQKRELLRNEIEKNKMSCNIIGSMNTNNTVILICLVQDIINLSEIYGEHISYIDIESKGAPTSMSGTDYRSNDGSQLHFYLTKNELGTLCHQSGGSRPCYDGSEVPVALLDGEGFLGVQHASPAPGHVAYRKNPWPDTTMRTIYKNCNGNTCQFETQDTCLPQNPTDLPPCISGNTPHGTVTMASAFSNILKGQHPLWTSLADKNDRSYGAYEAPLNLYRFSGAFSLEKSIRQAADDGSEIIALSWSNANRIDRNCHIGYSDHTATYDAWNYAMSLGAMGVVSADNFIKRFSDDCLVNPKATNDNILLVGGMREYGSSLVNFDYDSEPLMGFPATLISSSDNCIDQPNSSQRDDPATLAPDVLCWSSALGGANLRVNNTVISQARSRVDLVAPDGYYYTTKYSDNLSYFNENSGTSCSAPMVAAAATSLQDWANKNAVWFVSPGSLHNAMLLMGDGSRSSQNPVAPTNSYAGLDRSWGAGRMKMRIFENYGMNSPWSFGSWVSFLSSTNSTRIITLGKMPNDVDEIVAAMHWPEPNLNATDTTKNAADILLHIFYNVEVNGQCVSTNPMTLAFHDSSYDTHKIIRVQSDQIAILRNKCIYAKIVGSFPPSSNRTVYFSYYWEDRSDLDIPSNVE